METHQNHASPGASQRPVLGSNLSTELRTFEAQMGDMDNKLAWGQIWGKTWPPNGYLMGIQRVSNVEVYVKYHAETNQTLRFHVSTDCCE